MEREKNVPLSCDRNRLQLLLDDQLTLRDSVSAEQHLNQCPACRRDLEWMAADPHWWRDASEFLRLEETDSSNSSLLNSTPHSVMEHSTFDTILEYLEPCENPAMLGRLGGYEIVEVVGQGGMGVVLKGYDRELNRHVAVKVLAPHFAGSAAARQRFAREAQAAAAIVHPHVIPIHAVDVTGPLPYLVMPLIAGESLEQRLQRSGPLPLREILRIGLQAADGLAAAHAQGLVHRDIKPANILLEKGVDRVLLTDFGLARAVDDATLTRSGVIAGTPQYMSPEQARGDAVDCRSDLFSLGSVLYAMCTGLPPFRAETWMGVLRRITDNPARSIRETNPDIPAWLETLVARLHAKPALERPQTAAEVARTLEKCLAHVQQPTANELPESLRWTTAVPPPHPRRAILRGTLIGTIAVIVGVALWITGHNVKQSTSTSDDKHSPPPANLDAAADRPESSLAESESPQELNWGESIDQELSQLHIIMNVLEQQTSDVESQ